MCTEGLWDFKSCKQKSCVSPQARQDAFICTLSRDGLLLLWHTDQKMLVVFSGKIQAGSLPVSVYFCPGPFCMPAHYTGKLTAGLFFSFCYWSVDTPLLCSGNNYFL
jgi:hypothetical protein